MSSPRVSVILCSYNQGKWLREAVESVLAQTYSDWELIAIDNGSPDDSPAILQSYADDPRVKLVLHSNNQPVGRRLNDGIARARGELISFLYSDDVYLPDKLRLQVEAFDRLGPKVGVVTALSEGFNDEGRVWRRNDFIPPNSRPLAAMLDRYGQVAIDMLSPMSRRECWIRYPFYHDLYAEGEAGYLKVAMRYEFSHIDVVTVRLRDHAYNHGKAIKKNAEMAYLGLQRLVTHPDFPDELRPILDRSVARNWRLVGWVGARTGMDSSWVRDAFRKAIRHRPSEMLHPKMLVGLSLTALPASLRTRINEATHRLRGNPEKAVIIEGYERMTTGTSSEQRAQVGASGPL